MPTDPTYLQMEAEQRQAAIDIAVLKEQVGTLSRTMNEMRETLDTLAKEMADVSSTLAQARGGWKTLMVVGGAAASLAEAVHWVVAHVALKG